MSPIYTRPIREQLEHDRVIRELQARYKRKHEVAINPGGEQNQSVMVGEQVFYPDLVLLDGRRIEGTVEVETAESVHPLEARAEWGVLSRLKAPFYLYIPPQMADAARRICDEQQYDVAEIWTYYTGPDQQVRFTQIYKSPKSPRPLAAPKVASKPAPPRTVKPVVEAPRGLAKASPAPTTTASSTAPDQTSTSRKPAATARAAKPAPATSARTVTPARTSKVAKSAPAARTARTAKTAAPSRAPKAAPSSRTIKTSKTTKVTRTAKTAKTKTTGAAKAAPTPARGRASAKVPRSRR